MKSMTLAKKQSFVRSQTDDQMNQSMNPHHSQIINDVVPIMTQTSLKGNMYSYNKCFDRNRNTEVYNESCDEIVMSALNGINGTIFMYG